MYQPSQLRAFLDEHGITASKRLSQNFLIDGNIVRKLVAVAQVKKGDPVLEIGPGPGACTEELLLQGAHVIAVEKDALLAQTLQRLQTVDHRLHIIEQDILEVHLAQVLPKQKKVKVVANLPYHITTPILARLLQLHTLFCSITVIVQKEVAMRMQADPGSKTYGSLSVWIQFWSKPSYAFTISPHCFYPKPKVTAATVHLHLTKPPLPEKDHEAFFQMTRCAFQKRRKMLRNSLQELFQLRSMEQALEASGIAGTSRPEELSVAAWVRLYRALGRK